MYLNALFNIYKLYRYILIYIYRLIYLYMAEHWPSKCFEKAQSPLNIQRQLTVYDKSLSDKPLVLSGFDIDTVNHIKVKNNGHTGSCEGRVN